MTKEKQIEEMQNALIKIAKQSIMVDGLEDWSDVIAEELYNADYRKASDVAREIFEEIEEGLDKYYDERVRITNPALFNYRIHVANAIHELRMSINALKKKYTESSKEITEEGK